MCGAMSAAVEMNSRKLLQITFDGVPSCDKEGHMCMCDILHCEFTSVCFNKLPRREILAR